MKIIQKYLYSHNSHPISLQGGISRLNLQSFQNLCYNPGTISHGFESDNISPSENAAVIAEEKARQKIVEYLKDAKLESPQFQAFCDYADLQYGSELILKPRLPQGLRFMPDQLFNADMIAETIRQRSNGIKGYKRELYQVVDVTRDYLEVSQGRYPEPRAQIKFASELLKLKEHAIERKS
jgi:hypothetical protein